MKSMAHLCRCPAIQKRLLRTIPHLGVAIFDVAGGFTHLCVQLLLVGVRGISLGVDAVSALPLIVYVKSENSSSTASCKEV